MEKFKKKLSQLMELPPDAMSPVPRITVNGKSETLILGKTALIEYTRERIKLESEIMGVEINGKNLYISAMDRMGMCVTGDIESIRFGE